MAEPISFPDPFEKVTDAELREFEGIERRIVVDTSEGEAAYLLVGRNGSHIRLSPSAYNLLRIFTSGVSWQEAAEQVERHQGRKVDADKLQAACQRVARLVTEIDRNTDRSSVPFGFWLRIRLLPKETVAMLAARFSRAFHRYAVLPAAACIVFATVWMFLGRQDPGDLLHGAGFWPGYLLLLLSLLIHEMGHASACTRYGAPAHDIGFTLYLIYPALYADVTSAWQLNRWQRVVVDLGGAYFQLVIGAVYVGLFQVTGHPAFAVAFWMILYSLLFSLNPIFRFDGYWVLADALGVTNLGKKPGVILRHFFDRLRGREVDPLPWPRLVAVVLFVYTPATILFWSYFLWRLIPAALELLAHLPERLATLAGALMSRGGFDPGLLRDVVMPFFLLLIAVLMLWRVFGPLVKRLRSGLRRRLAASSSPQPPT